jgi:hypothetical protein
MAKTSNHYKDLALFVKSKKRSVDEFKRGVWLEQQFKCL